MAIIEQVRAGAAQPGEPLPSSRGLARELSVHRNTVLSSYRELEAEGWIETRPGKGTYVRRDLPETLQTSPWARRRDEPGYPLPPPVGELDRGAPPPGALQLSGGLPDPRLLPLELLGRALRRAARRGGHRLLDYGDPRGLMSLRRELTKMVRDARSIQTEASELMVTGGSQLAIYLAGQAILSPGATVAVEMLGYRPAWDALRAAGAKLIAVPVDEQGLDVERLAELASRQPIAAVYVTPHHQFPTTVTMSASRRARLLELARRQRMAIIEDDYAHELSFAQSPTPPLASADPEGLVIYIGTLSKVLAPGLRLGYAIAPEPVIERMAAYRLRVDRQGTALVQQAVADLFEDGEVARHVRRVARIYRRRRDLLAELLADRLGEHLEVEAPRGGMAFWLHVRGGIDPEAWAARAAARGVLFTAGRGYHFRRRRIARLRLGFARCEPEELGQAVAILAETAI